MKITRAPRQGHFTIIPNSTLRDADLSFRSRGVLAYLLSHDDGWSTSADRIKNAGVEGRDAIRKALDELKQTRYLVVRKSKGPDGRWVWEHFIYDTPQPEDNADDEVAIPTPDATGGAPNETKPQVRPGAGMPRTENQRAGNPHPVDQRRDDRQRVHSRSKEAPKKTIKNPPPPTAPAAETDPNSVTPEEEVVRTLIRTLPEALRPRSDRQTAALTDVLMPYILGGWTAKALHDHAALLPLPEMVLSPPGFIKQRLGHLPTTPPETSHESAPWCGQCHETTRFIEPDEGSPYRCPACHPSFLDADAS